MFLKEKKVTELAAKLLYNKSNYLLHCVFKWSTEMCKIDMYLCIHQWWANYGSGTGIKLFHLFCKSGINEVDNPYECFIFPVISVSPAANEFVF